MIRLATALMVGHKWGVTPAVVTGMIRKACWEQRHSIACMRLLQQLLWPVKHTPLCLYLPRSMADQASTMDTRTEKEKMLAGELYYAFEQQLLDERQVTKQLIHKYNTELAGGSMDGRTELLKQLVGSIDDNDPPFIEPPFYCDYGYNIHLGSGTYMNFGCTILDGCKVDIGSRVLFGPNVQVYSATHPLDGHVRQGTKGPEFSKPITIGDDVWVGGAAIICPGVTIGNNAVVGAGSVVTKDVEPYTVVAGNPAKLIRRLEKPNEQEGEMKN